MCPKLPVDLVTFELIADHWIGSPPKKFGQAVIVVGKFFDQVVKLDSFWDDGDEDPIDEEVELHYMPYIQECFEDWYAQQPAHKKLQIHAELAAHG